MRGLAGFVACSLLAGTPAGAAGGGEHDGERTSRLSDASVPDIDPDSMPKRPRPIVDLGNNFLGTATLRPGFRMPGGSVWQPTMLVYGTFRSALQKFDSGTSGTRDISEWANRLDLFTNVQLTGTERLVVGFRPFDEDGGFTGYNFEGGQGGSINDFNGEVATLFFEGSSLMQYNPEF